MRHGVRTWELAAVAALLAAACLWLRHDCRRLEALLKAAPSSLEVSAVEGKAQKNAQMAPEEREAARAELESQVAERKAECKRLEEQMAEAEEAMAGNAELEEISMAGLAELAPDLYAVVAEEVAAWHALQRNTRPLLEGLHILEGLGYLEPEQCRAMEDALTQRDAYVAAVLDGELGDEEAAERIQGLGEQLNSFAEPFEKCLLKAGAAMLDVEGKDAEETEEALGDIMGNASMTASLFLTFDLWWSEADASVYAQLRELGEDFPEDEEPELEEHEREELQAMAELLEKRREKP